MLILIGSYYEWDIKAENYLPYQKDAAQSSKPFQHLHHRLVWNARFCRPKLHKLYHLARAVYITSMEENEIERRDEIKTNHISDMLLFNGWFSS